MTKEKSQEKIILEEKKNKAFNLGDKVKLKFYNQYGFISRNDIISTNGCPIVEVMWITKLNPETNEIDEKFVPSYQNCYKESLIVLNKYNNETNKELSMT